MLYDWSPDEKEIVNDIYYRFTKMSKLSICMEYNRYDPSPYD